MKRRAFRAALPYTLPIAVGFLFIGMSYGFMVRSRGFSLIYPVAMSCLIFAGSMEFVTVQLLLSPFDPLHALALTLMVNARHLFYGVSMLERFRNTGWKKPYLIFGMCDETLPSPAPSRRLRTWTEAGSCFSSPCSTSSTGSAASRWARCSARSCISTPRALNLS